MKKILTLIAAALIACVSCVSFGANGNWNSKKIRGNGHVVIQYRDVQGFSKIKAGNALTVIISQGSKDSVVVEADDNLQEHIFTELDGEYLRIYADANFDNSKKIVRVTYKMIDGLDVSSAASLVSKSVINCSSLEIEVSSAATITAEVETKDTRVEASSAATCNIYGKLAYATLNASSAATINVDRLTCGKITAETSSAATINIDGTAGVLNATSSSASTINASDLKADDCELEASSGSSIHANAKNTINAEVSSGANITYRGTPQVKHQKTSSGGSLEQVD